MQKRCGSTVFNLKSSRLLAIFTLGLLVLVGILVPPGTLQATAVDDAVIADSVAPVVPSPPPSKQPVSLASYARLDAPAPPPRALADGAVEIWFQEGVSPSADYTGVDDTYISSEAPSSNFGTEGGMKIGYMGVLLRPLIRFDVSIIPSGSVVTEAKLYLFANYIKRRDEAISVGLYPLNKEWNELEANWYMATNVVAWDNEGADGPGDRSAEPIAEVEVQAINTWYEWDIREIVQNWVSDPAHNYGLILIATGPQLQVERGFWGSDHSSLAQRPKLKIVYTASSGATSTPTVTPLPTNAPTPTPTPRAIAYSSTTNCMTIGPEAPYPDAESVLLIWEGEPQWAKLYLDVSNDRRQHAIYVNGHFVGRSGGRNTGSTCSVGHTEEWDLDPSILVSGWNEIRITNDADPTDLWGATNGRIVIAGDIETPQYRNVNFVSSYDGYTQPGMIQVPIGYSGTEDVPLLVVLHWWGADYTDALYTYAIEANERGWLLASPGLRSQHTASLAVQHNVIDIVNFMRDNYRVDPSRIYLTGSSMGGMIAATTAAKYPDVFAAVVEEKGPTNLSNWYYETNSWRASVIEQEIGHAPWQAPFEYQRRSSESMAMNLKHVPLAITHPISDTVVPPSHAQGLYDAMNLFDPDHVELHWYEGDHDTISPYGPDWTLDFLGQWTLNDNPTDLNIRTDESKSFYWLDITQGGWTQRWTSVEASYDAYSNCIWATVSDAAHSPVDLAFDLAAMGLDTDVTYVVEDYNNDSGDFQVYTALPSAGYLSLSFPDGDSHDLSIYPGELPGVVTRIFQQDLEGYTGVQDTYLYAYDPDRNFASQGTVKLNWNSTYTALFRFDLSDLPSNAVIKSALLRLYIHGRSEDQNLEARAHVLLRNWDVEQATWKHATASEEWEMAGASGAGDRQEIPAATANLEDTRQWVTWNLRSVVEEWARDPSSNHGIVLKGQGPPSVYYELASSEYYAQDRKPELVVKYAMPTATPTPTCTFTPSPTPSQTLTPSMTPSLTPTASPTPQAAVIQGYVWNDVNGNGVKDEGENTLAGATLIVSDIMHREVARYITIADGLYIFTLPAPAYYYLEEINPRGYISAGDDLWQGEVAVGSVIEKNFADRPAPLHLPLVIKG